MIEYFDGFDGVFDLENSAFRGESVDSSIVVGPWLKRVYLELNMLDMGEKADIKIENQFKKYLNSNLCIDYWWLSLSNINFPNKTQQVYRKLSELIIYRIYSFKLKKT